MSLEERVFMPLFFLRHYLTFALLGFLFELHESNAYRNVGLTQLMSFCVGADDSLPENILYKGLKLPLLAA